MSHWALYSPNNTYLDGCDIVFITAATGERDRNENGSGCSSSALGEFGHV